MKSWSVDSVNFLISNYPDVSNEYIARELNKSLLSVNNKAQKLGLRKSKEYTSNINQKRIINKWGDKVWSKKDIDFLILNINILKNSELSNILGRSVDSIVYMCGKLKIKRENRYNQTYITDQCLKYITKSELRLNNPNLYHWLANNKKLDDNTEHMLKISYSTPQLILLYILQNLTDEYINYNDRQAIKPYELDIYFPKYKIGFEYDGSYFHDTENKTKKKICLDKGIELLIIDEKDIIKKDFDGYVSNIKKQVIKLLSVINNIFNLNKTGADVVNLNIDKSIIFRGLFNIEKYRNICDLYTNYTKFIKEQKNIYNSLYYLGLLDDFTKHMKLSDRENNSEKMKYLIESKNYYKVGDKVIVEYWYNDILTVCKIVDIFGRQYKVSHKIDESKIFNAPDEIIKTSDIIDIYKKSK